MEQLFIERYELKFMIPLSWVSEIEAYLAPYCALDKYSASEPEGYYPVNSLYLDSPTFILLRNRLDDVVERFTLRVRSYGKASNPPYFFEVKQRVGDFLRKSRGKCMDKEWSQWLTHPPEGRPISPELHRFIYLATTHQAEPKVLSQYRRKAYVSMVDRYARVTFDRDLRKFNTQSYELSPENCNMRSYDYADIFQPGCNVVLEIKCVADVPLWIMDLIRIFDLRRSSFSKYASSLSVGNPTPDLIHAESLFF